MHIQVQKSNKLSSGTGNNATASCTLVPSSDMQIRMTCVWAGFSGAAVATPIAGTISDGTTTLNFTAGTNAPFEIAFSSPLAFATGATVTVSLAAGGVGAVGAVAAAGYEVDPTKSE